MVSKEATPRHECSVMKMGGSKTDVCIAVCFAKAGPVFGEFWNSFNLLILYDNLSFSNFCWAIAKALEQKSCALQH
jgi:hypothetical protein